MVFLILNSPILTLPPVPDVAIEIPAGIYIPMKKLYVCLAVIVISIMLAGCGGGGGGGGTDPTPPDPNALVQLKAGNTFLYEGTESGGGPNPPTSTYTRRMSVTLSSAHPKYGKRSLTLNAELISKSWSGDSQYPIPDKAVMNWEQGANGTIYSVDAVDGGTLSGIPILCPSPLAIGQTYQYTVTWQDGSKLTVSGLVAAQEQAEGYMSYKIHEESTFISSDSAGNPPELTEMDRWFAPEIGCMVKWDSIMITNSSPWHHSTGKLVGRS